MNMRRSKLPKTNKCWEIYSKKELANTDKNIGHMSHLNRMCNLIFFILVNFIIQTEAKHISDYSLNGALRW